MPNIKVLDEKTINQIAAGEVVERPVSVVKELVENSIDAGADSISVEIKDGGISMIRITDNGFGIDKNNIRTAFLRHATSKIKTIEDLINVSSLGFRGEALSSIAAVSQIELLTKVKNEIFGLRFCLSGGREDSLDEVGVPDGTTIIVRNLFYNTPARRKFLKSANTEGNYISELMERLVLSHPEISFKYTVNGKERIVSSGNGDVKNIIYSLYGRDISKLVLPINYKCDDFEISGYIGKPEISRGNRNFELFFVNKRYIKSKIISAAVEEAYKSFMMLHKYPFALLYFTIPSKDLDVNVHPAKTEIKFLNENELYNTVVEEIRSILSTKELIPEITSDLYKLDNNELYEKISTPVINTGIDALVTANAKDSSENIINNNSENNISNEDVLADNVSDEELIIEEANNKALCNKEQTDICDGGNNCDKISWPEPFEKERIEKLRQPKDDKAAASDDFEVTDLRQEVLFEPEFLNTDKVLKHKIIGQIFDTYWIVELEGKIYIIDQHAAHEKVLYERFKKRIDNEAVFAQSMAPSIIVSLTLAEENIFMKYKDNFARLGFEIEHFGGMEYAITAVPTDLFGLDVKDYFFAVLDDLAKIYRVSDTKQIDDRIATMACKAAIKGNMHISLEEAKVLIDELLTLDNPYNCPHGRPTIVSYSKYEIEKMFKRIV